VIEKDAFPIIEATDRLRHFLLFSNGSRLLIDHCNLVYVLSPWYSDADLKKTNCGQDMPMGDKFERIPLHHRAFARRNKHLSTGFLKVEAKDYCKGELSQTTQSSR
jgi:hypothetical protein